MAEGQSTQWFKDRKAVLSHVLGLVADGTLSIDADGRVWRHYVLTRAGRRPVAARRAENQTRKGYLAVTFHMSRPSERFTRGVLAHVLVWAHANGSIPDGLQVNHKDSNKANNGLSNLELVDGSGNMTHSYASGRTRPWAHATEWRPGKRRLTHEQKQRVIDLRAAGKSYPAIVAETGISKTHVGRILKGGTK